jgi:hypothetical protein
MTGVEVSINGRIWVSIEEILDLSAVEYAKLFPLKWLSGGAARRREPFK